MKKNLLIMQYIYGADYIIEIHHNFGLCFSVEKVNSVDDKDKIINSLKEQRKITLIILAIHFRLFSILVASIKYKSKLGH